MTSHEREFLLARPCQHLVLASSQPRRYTSLSPWCYVYKSLLTQMAPLTFCSLSAMLMRDLFRSPPKFLIRWLAFLLLSFKNSLFILDPSRLAHVCHMDTIWLAHTCHMETSWLSHMCHMKTSWLAHICHICTSQLSTHTSHRYLFPFPSSRKVFERADFNSFCVYMGTCRYTYVCVHVLMGDRVNLEICSSGVIHEVFHWPQTSLSRLSRCQWVSETLLSLPAQHWDYTWAPTLLAFSWMQWGSNSGPHACTASIWPAKPSPRFQEILILVSCNYPTFLDHSV